MYNTRSNVLDLVHYGFSRDECYFMPLTEFMDYIKILNDRANKDRAGDNDLTPPEKTINDLKMAANTVPFSN